MKPGQNIPWFRHLASMLLLLILDVHQALRRSVSRAFLRVALGILALGLLAIVFSGLAALRQVSRSVESLVGDAMVGVESAVTMRAVVRETQLALLRVQLARDRQLHAAEIKDFKPKMAELLQSYRTGIHEREDEMNVRRIEQRLRDYLRALQPIIDRSQPEPAAVQVADQKARELVEAVELAYQFNRQRIHLSADEAGNAAKQALAISNRLWWSFGLFGLLSGLIYLAYRWLAVPEESDA